MVLEMHRKRYFRGTKKHQSCHRFQKDGRELKQRCLIQYGIEEAGFVCKDEICPRCEGSEELEEKEVL